MKEEDFGSQCMCIDICVGLCIDLHTDTYMDICTDPCTDMCMDTCMDTCRAMCGDMCTFDMTRAARDQNIAKNVPADVVRVCVHSHVCACVRAGMHAAPSVGFKCDPM